MAQLMDIVGEPTSRTTSQTRFTAVRSTRSMRLSRSTAVPQDQTLEASLNGSGASSIKKQDDVTGVRLSKVAALKAAIENGSYHVPAGALADKLIEVLIR